MFEAGEYIFQLGPGNAIKDGMMEFRCSMKEVKETLLFLVISLMKTGWPAGPYESFIFDIEILNVSNSQVKHTPRKEF